MFRYVYYNATDISAVDNSSDLMTYVLLNDTGHLTSSGLVELNVGLASDRVYNVLYENVAYCLVAFLVPLATLVVFNVRLVVQLRQSRQLRRTLRPIQFSRSFSSGGTLRGRGSAGQEGGELGGVGASSSGHDETNITLVMVVIIVVFIICELPASANQVCVLLQITVYSLYLDEHTATLVNLSASVGCRKCYDMCLHGANNLC